jgi:hypothetical protein
VVIVTVSQKKDDLVSFASRKSELTGLAKSSKSLMRLDDLAQRRRYRSVGIIIAVDGVESGDGFDQTGATLRGFLETRRLFPERRSVEQTDGKGFGDDTGSRHDADQ